MTKTHSVLTGLLLLTAFAVPTACAKKVTWQGPSSPGDPSASAPSASAPVASAAPTGSAVASGSATSSATSAASTPPSASAGVIVDLTEAAMEAGLKAAALQAAPGMDPDGLVLKGDMKENDHVQMIVTLQPNRCYTIIGFSPVGGVKNLDIRLFAPPFYNLLAAEDSTKDNTPVIGKAPKPLCPLIPLPIAYKLDGHAKSGAGRVTIQVFSKPK